MPILAPPATAIPTHHHGTTITISLLLALVCNLLPWRIDWLWLRPDFLLLVTLYWAIYRPDQIGVGHAWWFGLVEDFADGAHLGQHALAYAVTIYAVGLFQRRLFNFPPWQQALPVLVFLLIDEIVNLVVATFVGNSRTPLYYAFSTVTGMLCWFVLWIILHQLHNNAPHEKS
jgi:rod shape-determining protein MreD